MTSISNIRSREFNNCTFYWTIKSLSTCKKEGLEYISPQSLAIEKQNETNICLAQQSNKNYYSYGCMSYDDLNNIWREDNNLNELLREERKPYFDIEFVADNQIEAFKILNKVRLFIKGLFKSININVCLKNEMRTTGNIKCKWGGNGINKDSIKYSFHIVINNRYKFKDLKDLTIFREYMRMKIMDDHEMLFNNNESVIDLAVYTKNRIFKIPYQSKSGKNNSQIPITEIAGLKKDYELKEFLISYGLEDYNIIDVSNIELLTQTKIKNIRSKYNINNNITFNNWEISTVDKYYQYLENVKGDYKKNITVSNLSPEELLKCIYIDDKMPYDLYMGIGAGIKRCFKENTKKGFELWDKWCRGCSNYDYDYNVRQYEALNDNKIGYNTIYQIATLCNDQLNDYEDNIINQLFIEDFTKYKNITIKEDNTRYIDINHDIIKNNNITFIKSAMGTGKSYYIHNLLNDNNKFYKKCVYMSGRRAFACAMSKDFECDGFVNYLDKHYYGYENRQIISFESLIRCKIQPDLLIIDESETIFNIISSYTLYNNNFYENIKKLYNMISNTKNVIVMDAYLSNRSINTIYKILEKSIDLMNVYYYKNNFKYEERTVHILDYKNKLDDHSEFLNKLHTELNNKKRVCVICASRTIGEKVSSLCESLNKKYKYYYKESPLKENTDVNKEWSGIDCLLYTPTITCGISYVNDKYKYDTLFITALNKNSCVIRDIFQAHKRIRKFNNKNIYVYLNTCFKGNSDLLNPTNYETLKTLLNDNYKEITGDNYESIKDAEDEINWIYETHIFNTLERNINDNHLYKLFLKYCEFENINVIHDNNNNKLKDKKIELDIKDNKISYNDIEDIEEEQFIELSNKLNDDYYLCKDEMIKFRKYLYNIQVVDFDHKIKYFEHYINDDVNYKQYNNIKDFNKFVNIGETNYKKKYEKVNRIEFYNKKIMRFKHINNILSKLNIIDSDNKININNNFDTLDFEKLVDHYNKLNKLSINQLFDNKYIRDKNKKGENIKFTTRTMMSILNNLLTENFGMKIVTIKKKQKMINGKKKKITVYKIEGGDIINYFKNDKEINKYDIL